MQVFALVNSIACVFEVKYGMGRHVENVTLGETMEQLKVRHCTEPLAALRLANVRDSSSWWPFSTTTWA